MFYVPTPLGKGAIPDPNRDRSPSPNAMMLWRSARNASGGLTLTLTAALTLAPKRLAAHSPRPSSRVRVRVWVWVRFRVRFRVQTAATTFLKPVCKVGHHCHHHHHHCQHRQHQHRRCHRQQFNANINIANIGSFTNTSITIASITSPASRASTLPIPSPAIYSIYINIATIGNTSIVNTIVITMHAIPAIVSNIK